METRPLGRTGLAVSSLSCGCVELGMPYGIGVRSAADMLDEDQAAGLVRAAVERGITLFDTAPAYGRSEAVLGRGLQGLRHQVRICTKCPDLMDVEGRVLSMERLRDRLRSSLETSLAALRTEWVDVLMLHRVNDAVVQSDEVATIFADLKREGLIRAAGASTYPGGITGRVIASGRWDVVQAAINLMDHRELPHLAAAAAAGVGVLARSVLFKGILTDRGNSLHPALERVSVHRERCLRACPPGVSLAAFATRFVLGLEGVSSVLVGIDRLAYLDDALSAAALGPLRGSELETALGLAFPEPEFLDLHRWHVQGWLT